MINQDLETIKQLFINVPTNIGIVAGKAATQLKPRYQYLDLTGKWNGHIELLAAIYDISLPELLRVARESGEQTVLFKAYNDTKYKLYDSVSRELVAEYANVALVDAGCQTYSSFNGIRFQLGR